MINNGNILIAEKEKLLSFFLLFTQAVNKNTPSTQLYQMYKNVLEGFLGISHYVLYTDNISWQPTLSSMDNPPILTNDLILPYSMASQINQAALIKRDLNYIIPIYHKEQPLAVLLFNKIDASLISSQQQLFDFIQSISNIVMMAVENKRLFKKEVEKLQFDKELELASKVQNMLVPNHLPKNSLYEFAGLYLPHKGIGGDYYDVIHINKNEFVFCVADISGKGVAAALVMANIQAYINASTAFYKDLEDLIIRINKKVFSITKGDGYITLFMAKYNILTRELQYINAGHTPPLVINDNSLFALDTGCTLLGVFEQLPTINKGAFVVKENCTIVCYTDGLTELNNDNDELYEIDRLKKFLLKNHLMSPSVFNKLLYEDLSKFKGECLFNDDISVLTGRFF